MFEDKAFHVEIINKKTQDPDSEPTEKKNFHKEALYLAGLVVGVAGAIITMNTVSHLVVNAADQF